MSVNQVYCILCRIPLSMHSWKHLPLYLKCVFSAAWVVWVPSFLRGYCYLWCCTDFQRFWKCSSSFCFAVLIYGSWRKQGIPALKAGWWGNTLLFKTLLLRESFFPCWLICHGATGCLLWNASTLAKASGTCSNHPLKSRCRMLAKLHCCLKWTETVIENFSDPPLGRGRGWTLQGMIINAGQTAFQWSLTAIHDPEFRELLINFPRISCDTVWKPTLVGAKEAHILFF